MHSARPVTTRIALLLAVAGALASCASQRPTYVVWIVVDSLRADHLGSYGYPVPVSPSIDRLAHEGLLFEQAYATAPWTVPSVASMLTGLHPHQHGLTRLGRVLLPGLQSLPAFLQRNGYRTGAVVSHRLIGRRFQFDHGFDEFDEHEAQGHRHLSTPGVTRRSIALMRRFVAEERPFFLFVHYFDPHYQFRGHAAYGHAPPRAGSLTGDESIMLLRDRLAELTREEIDFLIARYDEEIRYTDEGIGELLTALEELGIADRTLVVFTADHGEEFVDRDWLGHTRTLYDELVRVPLLMRGPGISAGQRVSTPVSLVSLAATVVDQLGFSSTDTPFGDARPLPLEYSEPPTNTPVFSEVDYIDNERGFKGAHLKAMVDGDYKLIRDDLTGDLQLYDLANDPGERNDLAGVQPERRGQMLRRLEAHLGTTESTPPPTLDRMLSPHEIRELEALGYIDQP